MKIRPFVTLAAALALCGTVQAQSSNSGGTASDPENSATMPAEVVPPAAGSDTDNGMSNSSSTSSSGTSSATTSASPDYAMPTRAEVRAETKAMMRAGTIPHGELSTAYQDKGAQIGSTPF